MLQVQFIRQNPDLVKKRLAIKQFKEIGLVDQVVNLDDQRKKLQVENDNILAQINSNSKEIGQLMAKGEKDKAEMLKKLVASLKSSLQPIGEQLAATEKILQEALVKIPNLPSEKVPPGQISGRQ